MKLSRSTTLIALLSLQAAAFAVEPTGTETEQPLVTQKGPDVPPPSEGEENEGVHFSVDGSIDAKTAYYFRAYKIFNDFVVQPDVTLTLNNVPVGPLTVSPYINFWNNFGNTQGDGGLRYWTETNINPGVIVGYDRFSLDIQYMTNFLPSGVNPTTKAHGYDGQSQELDFNLSYDDSKKDEEGKIGPFTYSKGQFFPIALNPHILYAQEFEDRADNSLDSYLEFGIEPELRLGEKLSFTFPTLLGCSIDSYYTDSDGHNSFLGYVGTGVLAKYQLNKNWDIHGGVEYIYAIADSIPEFNGNSRNIFIGSIGVGFSF